jgi:tetratricopeptide (TPR) repeat protein
MNPRHLLGLTVLFRVLTAQAPRQPRAEADVLYAQAEAACASALVITPEDYNLMSCLGATLIQRAKLAAGVETDRLLAQARLECDKLLETKRGSLMGQQLLSYVPSAQAKRHSRAAADGIYAQAEEACASALAMAPEDCKPNVDLMAILGHILLHRALLDPGEKGSGYLARAREVLEETLRIRPAFDDARILWAHVLGEQSKRAPGEETDRALAEARASFDVAAGTTTDPAMVLLGTAAILFAQSMRITGEERVRLLLEAKDKFLASETRQPRTGAYRAACVCARLGEVEECRRWLEESREPGILVTRGEMADETHFENVRQCDWFEGLVAASAPPQS